MASPYADNGIQLPLGGASWGLGLDWGSLDHETAQLTAGDLVCMPRKFATATPHRRAFATATPQGVLGEPHLSIAGALVPVAPHWLCP